MATILGVDWTGLGDWTIKVLGALGGLIGTGLGIYNFSHARKKERRERANEKGDWELYLTLRAEMNRTGGNAFTPDEGSDDHQWAERMVAKGLLERGLGGNHYTMPRGS